MKAWGKEEGIKEGIATNTIDMVKKMLKENASIDFISRVSGLSKEEIEKMSKNI